MSECTFRVNGACALCNTSLEFMVGEYISSGRWKLVQEMICPHCRAVLTTVLRDSVGRFWGRRKPFND